MKGKYIYGVIKTEKPTSFGKIGIGTKDTSGVTRPARRSLGAGGRGSPDGGGISDVYTICFNNLDAVVSDSPWKVYKSVAKEETVKDLVTHQFVIEKVMEKFTILPVKFGTMLESEDEVSKFLEKGYFFLRNMLRQMEGKIELNVVASWKMPQAAALLYRRSSRIKRKQAEIAGLGDKAKLSDKIALGKLVERALSSKKERVSKLIAQTLKKEAVDFCPHDLADETMVFNAAFLIERQNEEFFNKSVNLLDQKLEDTINFRLVGPLPPYSFATIVVEKINPKEVEEAKKILGLENNITAKSVSSAYRKLAQEFHPDKKAGADPLHFSLINASYRVLKDFAEKGFIHVDIYRFQGAV